MISYFSNKRLVQKTRHFWSWFINNESRIIKYAKDQKIQNLINQKVAQLHKNLEWEIGPGLTKDFSFVISPGRNENLVKTAQAILEEAPQLSKWEFYFYKQPKNNPLLVKLQDKDGIKKELNAHDWEYMIYLFEDNKFDLVIYIGDSDNTFLDEKVFESGVSIIVQNILGEELITKHLNSIETVHEKSIESLNSYSSIKYLAKHLKEILN